MPPRRTPRAKLAASHTPEPDGPVRRILADAHAFYTSQLAGSWAPGYLHARGIPAAAIQHWYIGYAPAGWTALTSHLRCLGHDDDAIQAAGLATRSSRGTLIDRFRDRIMLPVRDADGKLAGFTGRAHPALTRGAIPVIAEGPFDAIAVSIADPGQHAGLAPCGTALTCEQATQLSQAADLSRTGILVVDSDTAGRKAAIRAHGILRPLTSKLQSAALDSKDPAEILQRDGPAALRVILREHRQPLSALLIDASIEQWEQRLDEIAGPLLAMRSVASVIASLLPDDTASQIRDITAGRGLQTTDDLLRPVDNPQIPPSADGPGKARTAGTPPSRNARQPRAADPACSLAAPPKVGLQPTVRGGHAGVHGSCTNSPQRGHGSARCRFLGAAKRSTRVPGVFSRERGLSGREPARTAAAIPA